MNPGIERRPQKLAPGLGPGVAERHHAFRLFLRRSGRGFGQGFEIRSSPLELVRRHELFRFDKIFLSQIALRDNRAKLLFAGVIEAGVVHRRGQFRERRKIQKCIDRLLDLVQVRAGDIRIDRACLQVPLVLARRVGLAGCITPVIELQRIGVVGGFRVGLRLLLCFRIIAFLGFRFRFHVVPHRWGD